MRLGEDLGPGPQVPGPLQLEVRGCAGRSAATSSPAAPGRQVVCSATVGSALASSSGSRQLCGSPPPWSGRRACRQVDVALGPAEPHLVAEPASAARGARQSRRPAAGRPASRARILDRCRPCRTVSVISAAMTLQSASRRLGAAPSSSGRTISSAGPGLTSSAMTARATGCRRHRRYRPRDTGRCRQHVASPRPIGAGWSRR